MQEIKLKAAHALMEPFVNIRQPERCYQDMFDKRVEAAVAKAIRLVSTVLFAFRTWIG